MLWRKTDRRAEKERERERERDRQSKTKIGIDANTHAPLNAAPLNPETLNTSQS